MAELRQDSDRLPQVIYVFRTVLASICAKGHFRASQLPREISLPRSYLDEFTLIDLERFVLFCDPLS